MRKEKAENGGKKAKMGEKKPKMGKNKPRKGGKKEKAPKAMENNGCEQWQRWESPGGAEVAPPPPFFGVGVHKSHNGKPRNPLFVPQNVAVCSALRCGDLWV